MLLVTVIDSQLIIK